MSTPLTTVKKFTDNWEAGNIRCCRTAFFTAKRYLKSFDGSLSDQVRDSLIGCIEFHLLKELQNRTGSMYVKD